MVTKYHDKDDRELLQTYNKDGNTEALGILLQRYTGMLLGVCMKYLKNEEEAKDSVQQVFLKVINELHKYKADYFKSWIYMVAKNHCLMKLRDNKKDTVEICEKIYAPDNEKDETNTAAKKEVTLNNLEVALKLLSVEQRVCLNLFYLQRKSYQEIIDLTGYNGLQVKSHIQNGKRNLKILMLRMPQHEQ